VSEELNRLRWRCQRGMLELDHILRGFLDDGYPTSSPEMQCAFKALLMLEDVDLFDLVMGRTAPDTVELATLLARLRHASEARG